MNQSRKVRKNVLKNLIHLWMKFQFFVSKAWHKGMHIAGQSRKQGSLFKPLRHSQLRSPKASEKNQKLNTQIGKHCCVLLRPFREWGRVVGSQVHPVTKGIFVPLPSSLQEVLSLRDPEKWDKVNKFF